MSSVLVNVGAGYIGSRTMLALLQARHDVVVVDSMCNSSTVSLRRVAQLAGFAPVFVEGDIGNSAVLDRIFAVHKI